MPLWPVDLRSRRTKPPTADTALHFCAKNARWNLLPITSQVWPEHSEAAERYGAISNTRAPPSSSVLLFSAPSFHWILAEGSGATLTVHPHSIRSRSRRLTSNKRGRQSSRERRNERIVTLIGSFSQVFPIHTFISLPVKVWNAYYACASNSKVKRVQGYFGHNLDLITKSFPFIENGWMWQILLY